jgi:hypothetical protein
MFFSVKEKAGQASVGQFCPEKKMLFTNMYNIMFKNGIIMHIWDEFFLIFGRKDRLA